jgi:Trk K+ transport system NAD-binding subunit
MIDMNPKTIFSDIDGTLVHQLDFESINPQTSIALPGVVEKMNQWFDEGHHIVLTTARPENLREITIEEMNILGIPFHQLVMGIGRAERILINNKSNTRPTEVRAVGIQVGKNEGFENIEI